MVSAEDAEHSEHLPVAKTDENVFQGCKLIHQHKRLTIHDLADHLGLFCGTSQDILCYCLLILSICTYLIKMLFLPMFSIG
jgi:hypothetical protein